MQTAGVDSIGLPVAGLDQAQARINARYGLPPNLGHSIASIKQCATLFEEANEAGQALDEASRVYAAWLRNQQMAPDIPDHRPVGARYIAKQDVDSAIVRVGNNFRSAVPYASDEIALAFLGSSPENNTRAAHVTYYTMRQNWNLSPRDKLDNVTGTVLLAEDKIKQISNELGIPYATNVTRLKTYLSYIKRIGSDIAEVIQEREKLPTILATFIGSAGLAYGVFGTRALKPAKLGFLFRHIL